MSDFPVSRSGAAKQVTARIRHSRSPHSNERLWPKVARPLAATIGHWRRGARMTATGRQRTVRC